MLQIDKDACELKEVREKVAPEVISKGI